ncbi:MAG: hypothetical protein ABFD76_06775 [Smithella sp.]
MDEQGIFWCEKCQTKNVLKIKRGFECFQCGSQYSYTENGLKLLGSGARPRGTDRAKVIQVIETESIEGTGLSKDDPVRAVYQYWTFDGKLLAKRGEYD